MTEYWTAAGCVLIKEDEGIPTRDEKQVQLFQSPASRLRIEQVADDSAEEVDAAENVIDFPRRRIECLWNIQAELKVDHVVHRGRK